MLNGQKLQGVETAREIHLFLKARGTDPKEYPLFDVVVSRLFRVVVVEMGLYLYCCWCVCVQYRIAYEGINPDQVTARI